MRYRGYRNLRSKKLIEPHFTEMKIIKPELTIIEEEPEPPSEQVEVEKPSFGKFMDE